MRYRPFNRAFSSRLLRGNRDIGTLTTRRGLDSRRFQDVRVTRKEKGKRLGWDDTSFGAHPSKPTAQPPYSNIHAVIDYAPDTLMVWGSNPSHDLDLQGLLGWPPATWRIIRCPHHHIDGTRLLRRSLGCPIFLGSRLGSAASWSIGSAVCRSVCGRNERL